MKCGSGDYQSMSGWANPWGKVEIIAGRVSKNSPLVFITFVWSRMSASPEWQPQGQISLLLTSSTSQVLVFHCILQKRVFNERWKRTIRAFTVSPLFPYFLLPHSLTAVWTLNIPQRPVCRRLGSRFRAFKKEDLMEESWFAGNVSLQGLLGPQPLLSLFQAWLLWGVLFSEPRVPHAMML